MLHGVPFLALRFQMLQQLQEFLNECIKRGWKPRGTDYISVEPKYGFPKVGFQLDEDRSHIHSYHDLFSTDSELMKFVGWKYTNFGHFASNHHRYHCKEMGPMTYEQKIQYFLDKALLPESQND